MFGHFALLRPLFLTSQRKTAAFSQATSCFLILRSVSCAPKNGAGFHNLSGVHGIGTFCRSRLANVSTLSWYNGGKNSIVFKYQGCGLHRSQHQLAEGKKDVPGDKPFSSGNGDGKDDKKRDGRKKEASKSQSHSSSVSSKSLSARRKVSSFLFGKFFEFVQRYQTWLGKMFPGAMHVYRVFVVGFKEFLKDFAEFIKIKTNVLFHPEILNVLTVKELDIYFRMPSEIFRVGPTLLISALPFANYVVFPIAYYFPKRLLSTHFWSIQQKYQFAIEFQTQRLYNYRPVFRCLQANFQQEDAMDLFEGVEEDCLLVLYKIGSGSHPSVEEILNIKSLFESHPFSIQAMYGPHVKGLCRMHGLHTMFLKRTRLYDRAEMLHLMDSALVREGIENLKTEEMRTACFLRGLNASNTTKEDMTEYLYHWTTISSKITPLSYSLLLHLPILLAYNNPNNWALLS